MNDTQGVRAARYSARPPLQATAFLLALFAMGCETLPDFGQVLDGSGDSRRPSMQQIAAGLREALEIGSQRAVEPLARADGFLNSGFRIPLPEKLREARDIGSRFGLGGVFDEMEVQLNRAAEAAAPKAQALFLTAIRQLTFQDVMAIYRGPDDAATEYLRRTTGAGLQSEMRPVVEQSLAQVGAARTFSSLARQYNRLPLVTPVEADLSEHVLGYASDAIYTQLAKEEAAIRRDPVKRTTELLRQVFGAL